MFIRRLAILLSLAAWSEIVLAKAAPAGLSKRQIAAIQSVMKDKLAKDHIPGASVAVGIGDKVVWSGGFGLADVENSVPATAKSSYRTASIGKPMTATAAMMLVEAGRLDLDAPVQSYCSRFPRKKWPITVRNLLNHTSGIRHYLPATEAAETYLSRHYDDAVSPLEIFENDPLLFEPGQDVTYSTWGYVLLGCVIQGAAGESYLTHMQRAVFAPAGMADTRDDDPRTLIPHRARGYVLRDGRILNSRFADMSGKLAAGGFITTAPDLVRFGLAFANDRLVSAAGRREMLAETRYGKGDSVNYGYGWLVNEHRGVPVASHGGGTPQVSALLLVVPERKVAIAIISNLEETPGRSDLGNALLDIVLGLPARR